MLASYLLAGAQFEAARRLPEDESLHRRRWHGHSFRIIARTASERCLALTSLQSALDQSVSTLNYHSLNDVLGRADDISIAEYISGHLPASSSVCLQSSPRYGVILDEQMALIWLEDAFEAAHRLPNVPEGHKCGRLHGHRFGIRLVAHAQQVTLSGLETRWQHFYQRLHNRYLNAICGLDNPTSEVIAAWLYAQIKAEMDGLAWVEVHETRTAGSQFDGTLFRIWKEHRFESATWLDNAGNYTGHSYLIRLVLCGDIESTLGWVLDFGDVKARFKPIYQQLDHYALDQIPGISSHSALSIVNWVYTQLAPQLPELARIDLLETPESGVSLHGYANMDWPLLFT